MIVKILQWNVWYKEDTDKIALEIKKLDPDIVCAQELIQNLKAGVDTASQIAAKIGYNYYYKEADTWSQREDKESQGNAIFSKKPILKTSFNYVQEPKHNPPDASHEGRVYIEAEVEIKGKKLTVGTVHLSYSKYFNLDESRKKEIDNLASVIKTKKKNYALTADLNSVPDDYAVKQLSKYLTSAGPSFVQKTWPTKPFDYHGFKEDKLNWRVDYIFTTPDIKIKKSKIVPTKVSDHLPILLEIDF